MITETEVKTAVERQRIFFNSGITLDVNWRIEQLNKLKKAILDNEEEIEKALYLDLGRSKVEAYLTDIGAVIVEINETIRGLRKWSKPERHFSGMICFPSLFTKVYKVPYGVTLIISPFNFPFMLSFGVLLAAIAGGNTAVIKASSKSENCTAVIRNIIAETFEPEYITVIEGPHEVADYCLKQRFDKIFYTGSPSVGKHVLHMAADNLTPVVLELGGETGNWCVIRKDADIKDAARKIAFFKLCNSGQICININQVAVAKEIADEFVEELKKAFINQIGENCCESEEYTKLINAAAFEKCEREAQLYKDRIVFGGKGNRDNLKYEPTIIYPVYINEAIVQHELFNPLLPVVTYKDNQIDDLLNVIREREKGLAFYLFTTDYKWADRIMSSMQFGGGCINEVCVHLMVKGVPFNGTGHSGMGAYHGKWGFNEFTHPQTVLKGNTKFNLPLREHPYSGKNEKLKMKLLKIFEK